MPTRESPDAEQWALHADTRTSSADRTGSAHHEKSRPATRPWQACLVDEVRHFGGTMPEVREGRWTAEIDGDFVVFLIGARINSKLQALRAFKDLGGSKGMRAMLAYLTEHPEKGLLGYETAGFTIIQYWRSFEHLEAFAKDKDDPHLEAWRNYWQRVGKTGRTGIWHETFLVRAGEYEAVYGNMPPRGLGKASKLVPLAAAAGARQRLRHLTG